MRTRAERQRPSAASCRATAQYPERVVVLFTGRGHTKISIEEARLLISDLQSSIQAAVEEITNPQMPSPFIRKEGTKS